jgi:hypothetical protein
MLPTTFAIRLRKGYGGQEATAGKMWKCCQWPMLPIANERKTMMKKIMMAVGFAARIHIGIDYASKRDQKRKWRFTCKTIARSAAASERSR